MTQEEAPTRELEENEISFKFIGGCTLDDLVLDFCNHFEEENEGHWPRIYRTDLIPGKLIVVELMREWFVGGRGVAVLTFYSKDDERGAVFPYIHTINSSFWSYRPIGELSKQVTHLLKEESRELIQLESQIQTGTQIEEEPSEESSTGQNQWLTPITFCQKCGAAIAIDESTYCWNCGSRLPRATDSTSTYGERTPKGQFHCDEIEYDQSCMICKLDFKDGQLLAWCPHCGAPAHRIHMLEWLHVKGICPACGQRLATLELEEQLSRANLHLQGSRASPARKKKTGSKRKLQ